MRLLGSLGAQPKSTFVTGLSNGGMMAYALSTAEV